MSGGFSFPPPPPPPPKAASGWDGGQNVQRGLQSRGGRGQSRSSGSQNPRGRGRGGPHQGNGNVNGNGNQHTPFQYNGNPGNSYPYGPQGQPQNYQQPQYQQPNPVVLPPGAYVNPNFPQQPNYGNAYALGQPSHASQGASPPIAGSPPRTYAGHKRKLDALRPPPQERKKPGPQTAPAVPSFGAPVLPPKPAYSWPQKRQPKAKAASNVLGLTPGNDEPQYLLSDDEADGKEVDEEALYAELGEKLTFEHNGTVMSLNSAADLAAWQEERKKKWPTRARMAENDAAKRRMGEERKRLLAGTTVLESAYAASQARTRHGSGKGKRLPQVASEAEAVDLTKDVVNGKKETESELSKARKELAEQTTKLDGLRRKVAEGEASLAKLKASRETENLISAGDVAKYGAAATVDGKDEGIAEGTGDSSSEILSDSSVFSSSSSEASDSDDDGPPEEATTKAPTAAAVGSQAPRCRYFAASGYCRDGESCRFRHELAPGAVVMTQERPPQRQDPYAPKLDDSATAGKKSIYQRLMEQQQEEEDRLALQVIKHLGKAGFFGAELAGLHVV